MPQVRVCVFVCEMEVCDERVCVQITKEGSGLEGSSMRVGVARFLFHFISSRIMLIVCICVRAFVCVLWEQRGRRREKCRQKSSSCTVGALSPCPCVISSTSIV